MRMLQMSTEDGEATLETPAGERQADPQGIPRQQPQYSQESRERGTRGTGAEGEMM